jgi:hypothetical protein
MQKNKSVSFGSGPASKTAARGFDTFHRCFTAPFGARSFTTPQRSRHAVVVNSADTPGFHPGAAGSMPAGRSRQTLIAQRTERGATNAEVEVRFLVGVRKARWSSGTDPRFSPGGRGFDSRTRYAVLAQWERHLVEGQASRGSTPRNRTQDKPLYPNWQRTHAQNVCGPGSNPGRGTSARWSRSAWMPDSDSGDRGSNPRRAAGPRGGTGDARGSNPRARHGRAGSTPAEGTGMPGTAKRLIEPSTK